MSPLAGGVVTTPPGDSQFDADSVLGPGLSLTLVAAVCEDEIEPGKLLANVGGEDPIHTISVLNVCGVDDDLPGQSHGIDCDVALTSIDLLAAVVADGLATLAGLDRLAVDDQERRGVFPAFAPSKPPPKMGVDAFLGAVSRPALEPRINRLIRREVVWKEPPRTARGPDIPNRVEDFAQAVLFREFRGFRDPERLDDGPLRIREIRRVGPAVGGGLGLAPMAGGVSRLVGLLGRFSLLPDQATLPNAPFPQRAPNRWLAHRISGLRTIRSATSYSRREGSASTMDATSSRNTGGSFG